MIRDFLLLLRSFFVCISLTTRVRGNDSIKLSAYAYSNNYGKIIGTYIDIGLLDVRYQLAGTASSLLTVSLFEN